MKTQGCSCEGASYGLPLGAPFREPLESSTGLGLSQRESLEGRSSVVPWRCRLGWVVDAPVLLKGVDRPIRRSVAGEPLQTKYGETDVKLFLMATMTGPSPLRPGRPGFFKAGRAFQRTKISSDSQSGRPRSGILS